MKEKKGFTIIELLVTIVILGLLLTIGLVSYRTISLSVRQRQYENVIKRIEAASLKYASETNAKVFTVKMVIEKGLLLADGNSNTIYSPVDKTDFGCYIINMIDGQAVFNRNSTGDCSDLNEVDNLDFQLRYVVSGSCSGNPRVWTNTNKVLCITSNTKDVSGIEEVYWSTPLAPDKMISGKTYEVKVAENSYVIEVYKARVKYNDGKNYLAKAEVRIDKVKPTCIFSGESTVWTNNNRAITLGCEDELSGCKTEGNSFTKTYTTTIKTDTFPSYEISDNVGNKTNCEGKEVDVYIDKDAPTISCVKSVINQPNGVTINCDCLDNDSGVLNCDSESIDIISNFTSSVVDKAGNSSTFITEVSSGLGRKDCETCKRCSDAGCESTYKCRCKTCEKTKSFFLKTYGNATLCFWKCESEHPGYSSYTCNLSNGLVSCYGRKKVYYDCECDTCCSKYKSSCLKCGCKTGSDWYLDSTCEPSAKVECSTIYY